MQKSNRNPSVELALHELKHLLPTQGPLKDFIHHNTLHAYQHLPFHNGLEHAARLTGVKVYLSKSEFFEKKNNGEINNFYLEHEFRKMGLTQSQEPINPQERRILHMRRLWKKHFHLDLDGRVHSTLFRWIGSYLDQGIAIWRFPAGTTGFLDALRKMDKESFVSVLGNGSARARKLFHAPKTTIEDILKLIVGDESLYGLYIFDQQFAHPGWSGLVSLLESEPEPLIARRKISLEEFILFELLLELDELDALLGTDRELMGSIYQGPKLEEILKPLPTRSEYAALRCWQEAYENTYYNQVLRALNQAPAPAATSERDFQAVFCIDDREGSLRRYIEALSPKAETLGVPGFFGVEFFYQPENSFYVTKLCPAPVNPKYLIKQSHSQLHRKKDLHLESSSHSFVGGWLISQTLGFWSAFKLFLQIFKPSLSPATATSLRHMDKVSKLTVENDHLHHHEHGLQVGFTIPEMVERVYNMLFSIGLTQNFADLVYLVGHGSSSINNPHYAAYDCGACSGRPGSVNARVFAHMANHEKVRELLKERGLIIPRTTLFVGALHDTTRDEIEFFEEQEWPQDFLNKHQKNQTIFCQALELNARERSRRFMNTPLSLNPKNYNDRAKIRSVSLFEPRPELNHATNSLCIVGRRSLTQQVFLDRRAFLNSYDASLDPDGQILTRILNAAVPVCGGINLEYYFSRVDNQKLGAGSKLPHNVMGLVGVANGIDGDLRPGLPSQMIEVHDPVRLLIVVEHSHDIALLAVQRNPATFEWVKNEWVRFASIHPKTREIHFYTDGTMQPFTPQGEAPQIDDIMSYVHSSRENLPIGIMKVSEAK